jgi:GT2 family glycosyltransferase
MTSLSPSNQPRVAIIMVNWNGWRECIECLDSLLVQEYRNFHLFIVDNDSQDASLESIAGWCARPMAQPEWRTLPGVLHYTDRPATASIDYRSIDKIDAQTAAIAADCLVTLIRSGGNLGFAAGCNLGIKIAGLDEFKYFWLLNPDTVVHRSALVELIARAQSCDNVGMVGSTVLFYHRPDTLQALGGGRLNRSNATVAHIGEGCSSAHIPRDGEAIERDLDFVFGASMLVAARFIREVGFMQEDYFLYYEELDWAMRGRGRFQLGFAPRSLVFHKSGANSSKTLPLFSSGHFYRNRLRFVRRFLPDRMAAAKRRLFEEMLRHVARGRWRMARLVWSTLLTEPKP